MLRRKYTIQKSIRFDEKLAEDLEFLAKELERTQNDLVNIAVEDLIHDNKAYFVKLMIKDELYDFLEGNCSTGHFDGAGLKIDAKWDESEDKFCLDIYHEDDKGNAIHEKMESISFDELEKYLTERAPFLLNRDSEDVKEYLKERLNYK